jgi:hypothetical protein
MYSVDPGSDEKVCAFPGCDYREGAVEGWKPDPCHHNSRIYYNTMVSRYQEIFQCLTCKVVLKRTFNPCSMCGSEGRVVAEETIVDPSDYGLGFGEDGIIMRKEFLAAWAARDAFFKQPWYKRWYKIAPRKPY